MAKRAGRRTKASADAAAAGRRAHGQPVVTIRAHDSRGLFEAEVTRAAELERLAQEWAYILRARPRWMDTVARRRFLADRAIADLGHMGVSRDRFIRRLASVDHGKSVTRVEVELHAWDPTHDETNRIYEAAAEIPWEYLIAAATSKEGRFASLLVTRLFRNKSKAIDAPPAHVLFVESAPGRLADVYGFESERVRIGAAVGANREHTEDDAAADRRMMEILETPSVSELKTKVKGGQWEVIHVTGVDTHQAERYIEDIYEKFSDNPGIWNKIALSGGQIRDGMILRDRNIAELPVNYRDLARMLVNPENPPYLVTLNLYHSGARTARELVSRGAHAALGFLDEIDDESAELFFQAFYLAWCRPGSAMSIPDAFAEAWQKMSGERLHGTAIVIWMGRSAFEKSWSPQSTAIRQDIPAENRQDRLARQRQRPIGELLQVEFLVDDEVNYSLLHNDRQLIRKLTLTKLVKEPLEDITVLVELNLGADNYPFRCTYSVFDQAQLIIAPEVKIPLTAALPRSLRERVRSTVYVKVTCGGRTAYEGTARVTLIPVDEWLDDTKNNPWLPSFVLPRDRAILKIIGSSRRYLIGIQDDATAGFDGYQSVDEKKPDPGAGVNTQVQAIWTALVNEYRLQYINPPPAYSEQTQRLRTPTEILASNSGTCIDLALLLASCLEYIEVFPVIVLLKGHAFVGYWRSESAHDRFAKVEKIPPEVPATGSRVARKTKLPYVDKYGWRLTRLNYDEILEFVTAGDLVMLEATYLTSGSSFRDAKEEGRANLRSRREFDSLLDIRLARSASPPVTPLPIINE